MMKRYYANSMYRLYHADAFEWLPQQRASSLHAVVTDPPFTTLEYSSKELSKRRRGKGGVWRLPVAFDGNNRRPSPRFTVLSGHDRMGVLAFHLRLAPALHRVLVPGAHVIIATQCLVSHLVAQAFVMAGFEVRGQLVRIVRTLRGGDRPKFGHEDFTEVSVIPRSCFEPWLLFRKPCQGRVVDNLRRFGTGALRRPTRDEPFLDVIEASPARNAERKLANHPSLKPQRLMRRIVHAALPLGRGVILDPFMGSGATVAAAKALDLKAVGVESDTRYFAMARASIPQLAELPVDSPGLSA